MIGSSARALTYAQLMAVPVGAAAVSYVYPLLRDTYGIGGEHGLQSPISQKWAGFAQLLSKGLSALPPGNFLNEYPYNRFGPGYAGISAKMGARAIITLPPARPDLHLSGGRYRLVLHSVDGHPFTLILDRSG